MGSTYFNKRIPQRTATRRPRKRSKSFDSEEKAKAWAEKQGLKDYKVVNLRSSEAKTKKVAVKF